MGWLCTLLHTQVHTHLRKNWLTQPDNVPHAHQGAKIFLPNFLWTSPIPIPPISLVLVVLGPLEEEFHFQGICMQMPCGSQKPQIAPKMYLSGQKYIINTWSYTTINMSIPFDSLFHFDWVTWCCYHQKWAKNAPKWRFFTQNTRKVPFWSKFFSENYFFEIAQSKYRWVNIKNVISEKLIFDQKSQFTPYLV